MSRIHQITPDSATGKAKELLDAVKGKRGIVRSLSVHVQKRCLFCLPPILAGSLSKFAVETAAHMLGI